MALRNRGNIIGLLAQLLEYFAERRTPVRFLDLIVELGIERRTLYRYLQSLEASGFVERVHQRPRGKAGQEWRAGRRLLWLTQGRAA